VRGATNQGLVRSEEDFEPKERLHDHIQVNCDKYCKKIANIPPSSINLVSRGRRGEGSDEHFSRCQPQLNRRRCHLGTAVSITWSSGNISVMLRRTSLALSRSWLP
jgi:hypothetical protein